MGDLRREREMPLVVRIAAIEEDKPATGTCHQGATERATTGSRGAGDAPLHQPRPQLIHSEARELDEDKRQRPAHGAFERARVWLFVTNVAPEPLSTRDDLLLD